jgi:hypothetical protein
LRLAFWMAGLVAIHQRENAFRDKYERYPSATPFDADRKRKALSALAAKMARVAYAVIKPILITNTFSNTEFPVDRSLSHDPLRRFRPRR